MTPELCLTATEKQDSDQIGQFSRIVQLLRKSGLKTDEAVELAERMSNIASTNTIAQFGSKIDSLESTLRAELRAQDAKLDAQNAKYNVLIWVIGFATAILSAVILFSNSG